MSPWIATNRPGGGPVIAPASWNHELAMAVLHQGPRGFLGHLEVELDPHDPRAELERLVAAPVTGKEPDSPPGELERVPVPVKNDAGIRDRGGGSRAGGVARVAHGKPADLLLPVGKDPRAQRARDELRPEADAENAPALRDRLGDGALFSRQPRIAGLIVHAHRPAHHDEPVVCPDARQGIPAEETGEGDGRAPALEPVPDGTNALEGHVLEYLDAHGGALLQARP